MNKSTIAAAILFGLSSASALAANDNNYQHEAQLDYKTSSEEFSDGNWDLNYRYYTSPVDQKTVPYALSGFLAQTSNVGAHYGFDNSNNNDINRYGIDGEYVFDSKWFIGAIIDRTDYDVADTDSYGIQGGYYFNDTSAVYATYSRTNHNFDSRYFPNYVSDTDTDNFAFGVKGYLPFKTTEGILLAAEYNNYHFSYSDYNVSSTLNTFDMKADWYITRAWSFGGIYQITDESGSDDNYALNTAYFLRITDSISARILVAKQFEPDSDGVFGTLSLNGRF
ncbi:putative porin [Shewanella surugensis]|uniref:Porin n=1 Tax=Shewanella surugensis TaxID=212020 RepID=A0ABT0LBS6_9GAMM|nr:putative porin [Shewanella surugensis]MCL1125148.1 hypothetical protein [Shewanella surugensis]